MKKILNNENSMQSDCTYSMELRVVIDSFRGISLHESECPKSQCKSILKELNNTLSSMSYPPCEVKNYGITPVAKWTIPMPYQPKKFLKEEVKRLHKNLAISLRKMGIEFFIMYVDGKFVMYEYDENYNCIYDHAKDKDFLRKDKTTTPIEEFYAELGLEIGVIQK